MKRFSISLIATLTIGIALASAGSSLDYPQIAQLPAGSVTASTKMMQQCPGSAYCFQSFTADSISAYASRRDTARAIRATSPTRLLAFTTTIQVVSTNATVFTLAGPGFAGHVEKIVIAPGATLPADAGGVTIAITKTGGTVLTAASTVDLTSGGETASTAHAEALNATVANNNIAATNVVVATLATDGTVTTAGSPILITVWYSLDNP